MLGVGSRVVEAEHFLKPDELASSSVPEPLCFVAGSVGLSEATEEWFVLDVWGTDCCLEYEWIVPSEQESGYDGHMRDGDPPELVSMKSVKLHEILDLPHAECQCMSSLILSHCIFDV